MEEKTELRPLVPNRIRSSANWALELSRLISNFEKSFDPLEEIFPADRLGDEGVSPDLGMLKSFLLGDERRHENNPRERE